LRSALEDGGISPGTSAVVSVTPDVVGDPLSGIVITSDGRAYGFVRDPESGQFMIGGGEGETGSLAVPMGPAKSVALELSEDRKG